MPAFKRPASGRTGLNTSSRGLKKCNTVTQLRIFKASRFMSSLPAQDIRLREARAPFKFNSSAYLLRIGWQKANNLGELLEALHTCPEESIFQHTFLTLQEHHFFRTGFSNDFAHWAYADCNEVALAEWLAGVDVRAFTSVAELRERLVEVVSSYLAAHPQAGHRPALKPFYFCASDSSPRTVVYVGASDRSACTAFIIISSKHVSGSSCGPMTSRYGWRRMRVYPRLPPG